MSVYDGPDPSDIPGTTAFAEAQADMRRDAETDNLYQRVIKADRDRLMGWLLGRAPEILEHVLDDMERFDREHPPVRSRRHPSLHGNGLAGTALRPVEDPPLREGVPPHLKGVI